MRLIRSIGRAMVAWMFIAAAIDVLRDPGPRAELASGTIARVRGAVPAIPDDDVAVVRMNAGIQIGASVLLLLDRVPRLSSLVLAGSMVPTTVGGHPFWSVEDPSRRVQQRVHFNKNVAITGGLLLSALGGPQGRRGRRRRPKVTAS